MAATAKASINTKITYTKKRLGTNGTVAVPSTEPVTLDDVTAVMKMIIKDVFDH